ncbi:hypothetical protein [Clavibacter zhangzhiyongii]|uniref:hypothetical protein n=1 Tax=Clavibacter zhangzhiyongii TaxID=2768071 RepID=UPI0039E1208F
MLKTNQVDTFTEFVLRAVDLGVDTADDITALLNLPPELVDGVLAELLLNRHVMVTVSDGNGLFTLSTTGHTLVDTLVDERVVPATLTYFVDGLSGEPLAVPKELVLTPAEIDDEPRLILESDSDVDLQFGPLDSNRFIDVNPVKPEHNTSLLTVLSVASTTKQYIDAAVLLFESEQDSSDRYLRVCIDGRADERVERQVRELGILKAMRLDSRIDEDRRRVNRLIPQVLLSALTPDTEVETALGELEKLQAITASDEEETAIDARRQKLRTQLAGFAVRRLPLREATEALEVRLLRARSGLWVSASWLWPRARREHHIELLREVIANGCPITLESPPIDNLSRADKAELQVVREQLGGVGLTLKSTKPVQEASFIVFDNTAMAVFTGAPFIEAASIANRLGDDRPILIQGKEQVSLVPQHDRTTGRPRARENFGNLSPLIILQRN